MTSGTQPATGATHPDRADNQLQAHNSERVFQATGNQYILERPAAGRTSATVTNTLPRDIAAFTGRVDELDALTTAVTESKGSAEVIAIYAIDGMPGVGKTALAVHAAHRLSTHFPAGQLFVDLHAHTPNHPPVEPADALFSLLTADGVVPKQIPAGLDARAAQWRGRIAGKRLILILDDAAGHAQVEPLLPGAPGCLVLITSRRRLAGLSARHATAPLALDTLPPDQAEALFARLLCRSLPPAETHAVSAVVRLCGYLPLAITLLAAKLRPEPRWRVADLLADMTAARDRLAHLQAEDIAVAAAFDLSYRNLPAARRRFFRRLGLHPGVEVGPHAAAALDGITVAEARRHLDALYQDRLIDQPVRGRFRMHDLIGEYARGLSGKDSAGEREQALARVLDHYERTAKQANRYLDPRAPTTPDDQRFSSLNEASAWMRQEIGNLFACVSYAERHDRRRVVPLAAALSAHLLGAGPWRRGVALHRTAAQVAREQGDGIAEADALCRLGVVLGRIGDYAAARSTLQTALDVARRVESRRAEADILTGLGVVHRLWSRLPEAVEATRAALEIYHELANDLGKADALSSLAVAQWLTDDFAGAAATLREALDIHRNHADPHGHADALFRLGVVQRMTHDYPAAMASLQSALTIFEELGDRLGQANVRHNRGIILRMTDHDDEAIREHGEALATYEAIGDPLGQANALKNAGIALSRTGDLEEADRSLHRSMAIYRELGDELGLAGALQGLGDIKRKQGDLAAARRHLGQALDRYQALGSQVGQSETLIHMGAVLLQTHNAAQARIRYEAALRLAREAGTALEEARALAGLAECDRSEQNSVDAVSNLRQALLIFTRIGAPEMALVARQLDELAPAGNTTAARS